MRVRLTKQAQRDVAQAANGTRQSVKVLAMNSLIVCRKGSTRLNPLGYTKLRGENRRCNLGQFPYALWFKIVDEIVVVGCLHGRRQPVLAKERGAGVIEIPKPPEPS